MTSSDATAPSDATAGIAGTLTPLSALLDAREDASMASSDAVPPSATTHGYGAEDVLGEPVASVAPAVGDTAHLGLVEGRSSSPARPGTGDPKTGPGANTTDPDSVLCAPPGFETRLVDGSAGADEHKEAATTGDITATGETVVFDDVVLPSSTPLVGFP